MRRNLSRYRRSLGLRFAAEVAESVSPEEKEQVLMRFGAWDKSHPITPEWLWSEKFDGVRSLFLPASGTLESRNGRNLAAPEEFVSYLQDFNRHLARTLFEYHYRMPYAEQELDRLSVAPFHIALDGELWGGRDRFQELISAVKTPATLNPPQERWKFQLGLRHAHAEELLQQSEIVRAQEEGRSAVELLAPQRPSQRSPGGGHWGVYFMVFDWLCQSAPPCLLEHLRGMPFGERYEMLQRAHATFVAEAGASPVRVVEHGSCSNIDDPEGPSALIAVLLPHHSTSWGLPEGVMLRGQGGSYENGRRSLQVLKVKSDLEYECLCVGVTEGQGRLQGLVGALECEIVGRDGRLLHFSCGSGLSDEDRWPLNKARTEFDPRKPEGKSGYIGRVLTLRCNGHTDSGRPRFPRFMRWRSDRDRSEMRLFGSGMQSDARVRTVTCRVARGIGLDTRRILEGEKLELVVVSGESTGDTFSVDERSIPQELRRLSPVDLARVTVQLFGEQNASCPLITNWETAPQDATDTPEPTAVPHTVEAASEEGLQAGHKQADREAAPSAEAPQPATSRTADKGQRRKEKKHSRRNQKAAREVAEQHQTDMPHPGDQVIEEEGQKCWEAARSVSHTVDQRSRERKRSRRSQHAIREAVVQHQISLQRQSRCHSTSSVGVEEEHSQLSTPAAAIQSKRLKKEVSHSETSMTDGKQQQLKTDAKRKVISKPKVAEVLRPPPVVAALHNPKLEAGTAAPHAKVHRGRTNPEFRTLRDQSSMQGCATQNKLETSEVKAKAAPSTRSYLVQYGADSIATVDVHLVPDESFQHYDDPPRLPNSPHLLSLAVASMAIPASSA
eukprot:Hpha_TRINITY_DN15029_c5_g2::TRINITY_DN15029_c5_g2_i4::g.125694::m.125694